MVITNTSSSRSSTVDGGSFISIDQSSIFRKVELTIGTTITDISDYVVSISVSKNAYGNPWSANITLSNNSGYFSNKLTNYNVIKVYYDYTDGTTQQFEGHLYKYNLSLNESNGRVATVNCYDYTYRFNSILIWKTYTETKTADTIIKELLDEYAPEFTYTHVHPVADTLAPSFSGVSLLEALRTIAGAVNCHLFCAGSTFKNFYFHKKGESDHQNTTEVIAYANNLKGISNTKDLTNLKTKLFCTGHTLDGLENLTITENETSTSTYDSFEMKFNDSSALTKAGLITSGTRKLNEVSAQKDIGYGTCLGLINQIPGYSIQIISPYESIVGYKDLVDFTTTYNTSGLVTSFSFSNVRQDLGIVITEIDSKTEKNLASSIFGMKYSLNWQFTTDVDIDLATSTNVASYQNENSEDTVLAVITGSTGTWISPVQIAKIDSVTEIIIKTNADYKTDACTFWVSCSYTPLWESVDMQEDTHTVINPGKYLRVKIVMNNDSADRIPQFDSAALLYK